MLGTMLSLFSTAAAAALAFVHFHYVDTRSWRWQECQEYAQPGWRVDATR